MPSYNISRLVFSSVDSSWSKMNLPSHHLLLQPTEVVVASEILLRVSLATNSSQNLIRTRSTLALHLTVIHHFRRLDRQVTFEGDTLVWAVKEAGFCLLICCLVAQTGTCLFLCSVLFLSEPCQIDNFV